MHIDGADGRVRYRWVKAPTTEELTQLAHTIAHRVGRYLERQGLLERDAENSYLAWDAVDEDAMTPLLGHSITYRIAVGPQAGRKVFTLQILPACDPEDRLSNIPGILVHGRYDMVCPLDNAYDLSRAWPSAELQIIRDAGHSASEPGIVDALVRATDDIAKRYECDEL